jgi:hypothetical protein
MPFPDMHRPGVPLCTELVARLRAGFPGRLLARKPLALSARWGARQGTDRIRAQSCFRRDASVPSGSWQALAPDDTRSSASARSSRPRWVWSECVRSTNTCGTAEGRH